MEKPSSALEKRFQTELDALKSTQKEYEKLVQQRQLLDGQLNENKNVLDELNLLNDSNDVYKLFGPILIKQTLEESKQNVNKRVEYINGELNRCQKTLAELDKKQEKARETLMKLQQQHQASLVSK